MNRTANKYLEAFSEKQRIAIIVLMDFIAQGFEDNHIDYVVVINEQSKNLNVNFIDLSNYLVNFKSEIFKNTFSNFNSFQKDLLIYLNIELLLYNVEGISDKNIEYSKNCFLKYVKISESEYEERLQNCLRLFISFTESRVKSLEYSSLENNHNAIDRTMNNSDVHNSKKCYIATLAYGDINHPKVELFRTYRDDVLSKNLLGRIFINVYYKISPTLVEILKPYLKINRALRFFLNRILLLIYKKQA